MIDPIIASAIGGGIGGAVGMVITYLMRGIHKKTSSSKNIIFIIIVLGCVTAGINIFAYFNGPSIEDRLDRIKVLAIIHDYHQKDYSKILYEIKREKLNAKSNDSEILKVAEPYIIDIVASHAQDLSEESARDMFLLSTLELKNFLNNNQYKECYFFAANKLSNADLSTKIPQEIIKKELDIQEKVLYQIAINPAKHSQPLSRTEIIPLAQDAFLHLKKEDRDAVIPLLDYNKIPSSDSEMRAMCKFYIAFNDAVLSDKFGTAKRMIISKK